MSRMKAKIKGGKMKPNLRALKLRKPRKPQNSPKRRLKLQKLKMIKMSKMTKMAKMTMMMMKKKIRTMSQNAQNRNLSLAQIQRTKEMTQTQFQKFRLKNQSDSTMLIIHL